MEENKTAQKLSYEQLEQVASQLSQQVQNLYAKLQEAEVSNMLSRLNFLFKVVENDSKFPADFVAKCVAEIIEIMTIKEPEESKEE